jgi:hypothetical protein
VTLVLSDADVARIAHAVAAELGAADHLLDVRDAAAFCKLSTDAIYRSPQRFGGFRVGTGKRGRWRFTRAGILAALDAQPEAYPGSRWSGSPEPPAQAVAKRSARRTADAGPNRDPIPALELLQARRPR